MQEQSIPQVHWIDEPCDVQQRSRLKQVAHADPAAEAGTSAQAAAPEEDAAAPDTQQLHAAVANTEGSDDDDEEEDDEDFDADAEEVLIPASYICLVLSTSCSLLVCRFCVSAATRLAAHPCMVHALIFVH